MLFLKEAEREVEVVHHLAEEALPHQDLEHRVTEAARGPAMVRRRP